MVYLLGKYIRCYLFLFLALSCYTSYSQNSQSWIVSYHKDHQPSIQQQKNQEGVSEARCIFKDLNIWELTTTEPSIFLKNIQANSHVRYYHSNIKASSRFTPNDPEYVGQWNMTQVGMDRAWDITTGGKLPNGDDIVVAIFDEGYQMDHPELVDNIWHNPHEIPDNGLDDDGNGYIDDYDGWNSTELNDDHRINRHGTAVAGLVGAKGNNQSQIAGANWDVKLMLTSGGRQAGVNLADIVAAYDYIYTQRKLYNETNGALGAYVVVSNYSGGAANRFPSDFPAWCEVFDALGSVGVLNIGAAPNSDTNIDTEGDLPGTCPSDFLIVVTNTDRLDRKVTSAGYGAIGVDIGAPGDNIITTDVGSTTRDDFFGSSGAAPQVAGTISLMYSLICPESFAQSLSDPPSIALLMRSALLNSATIQPSLEDITVTGGRLNALAAVTLINESTVGNCCEITINNLELMQESCIGSQDAQILITASGKDLVGTLRYAIQSSDYADINRLGSFARIPGGLYQLLIEDDQQSDCFTDTLITVASGVAECPFSEFAITQLRDNGNHTITVAYTIDQQKEVQIQVHNNAGQLLYNALVTPELSGVRLHDINTNYWPSGVYHASILATGYRDVSSFYVIN